MSLTKVSYSMIDGTPLNVLDYGADPTGVADSYAAFVAALAAGSNVYVPQGTYKLTQTLSITGEKLFYGPTSSSSSLQLAVLNFTGTGNGIQAISAQFGGLCIRNFMIIGGDGSGAYAIYSTRPQTVIENIHMEGWDNSGIALEEAGTGSQASWGTLVRQCKWIGPATATPYFGFQVAINGGHVTLDGCEAIRGSIGINIDQGQAINIYRCSTNLQCNTVTYPFSSLARNQQCAIRLSSDAYKTAVSIRECYLEAFTNGIYVEACESLSIEDNYIADSGVAGDFVGVPGSLIYLKEYTTSPDYIKNVTIRNNRISGSGNGVKTIFIGEDAEHIEVYNNDIAATGSTGYLGALPTAIYKESGYYSYIGDNRFRLNPFIGVRTSDASKLLAEMFWVTNTWVAAIKGSTTSGTYQIASQSSSWTKIGRSITLNCKITLAAVVTGGGTGNLAVALDTIVAGGVNASTRAGKIAYGSVSLSGVNYTTSGASISAEADGTNHSNQIWFVETVDNAASAYIPIGAVAANSVIAFSITYEF
jgi:stage V sporulation protein SpoVS